MSAAGSSVASTGWTAEVARAARDEVSRAPQGLVDASPDGREPPADDPLDRVQTDFQPRGDAEAAAPAAEAQSSWRSRQTAHGSHAVRIDELGGDEVVARETVLGGQVADPPPSVRPGTPVEPTMPSG